MTYTFAYKRCADINMCLQVVTHMYVYITCDVINICFKL